MKRENAISWDEYFMGIAELSAKRSKDPSTQVGACIVNNKRHIVGIGYNGFPIGCDDDDFPWNKETTGLNSKYLYVCHAELNAILNSHTDLDNTTLYVTLFPCNECAKAIIQSGIKKIFFLSDKYKYSESTKAAKLMFKAANVEFSKLSMS